MSNKNRSNPNKYVCKFLIIHNVNKIINKSHLGQRYESNQKVKNELNLCIIQKKKVKKIETYL